MRVCQVMLAKGFGGAERYFVDLSRDLSGRGHEVIAVCHPRGMAHRALSESKGPEVATLGNLGFWDPFSPRRLQRLLAEFRPDVVHAHLARAARIAGLAGVRLGIPVVAKTHNYVDLRHYRAMSMFVATTADQHRFLIDNGIPAARVRQIPNFSSMPVREPAGGRVPAIVAMGRFVPKKGFHELLSACALMRGRGFELPPVLLGGDGPLAGELRIEAHRLGLDDVVQFAGWQDDAGAFLDRGALFVLPSLDEPFGIAIIEAMARGLPIVATRTQGPREILDAETAWLVPPGDSESLANAMIEALSRPAEAINRARVASARYRAAYCADAVVPRIVQVYEEAKTLPLQKT